ncbi:MAG TPA: cytochrome c [Terriglobales bacterium]|nr:cytochrome c [Terriglobales bacterium]
MGNSISILQINFWVLLGIFPLFAAGVQAQTDKNLVAKGQYIFALAGGCACHTDPKGTPHAGGRAFPIPFGTVYSTNITPDRETGLGAWTDSQIHEAMVKGVSRDGRKILPVMPFEAYSGMAGEDLTSLIAYLGTLKPVKKATPPLKTWVPLIRSLVTPVYLKIFGRFYSPTAPPPESGIERGRYLANHVSLCGDCHTPRNSIGVPNRSFYLAGASAKTGFLGEDVPNITPDKETGIGDWKRDDIAHLLLTGTKPDLDNVQGLMAEVVEHGYQSMRKDDALAIADYLKSIPPVKNRIK